MEVPALFTEGMDLLSEKGDPHIIPAVVAPVGGVKRLMKIGDKVNEKLQRLSPLYCGTVPIGKSPPEPLDGADHTLLLGAVPPWVVARCFKRNIDKMPRRRFGTISPNPIGPICNRCERGLPDQRLDLILRTVVQVARCHVGNNSMPRLPPSKERVREKKKGKEKEERVNPMRPLARRMIRTLQFTSARQRSPSSEEDR